MRSTLKSPLTFASTRENVERKMLNIVNAMERSERNVTKVAMDSYC